MYIINIKSTEWSAEELDQELSSLINQLKSKQAIFEYKIHKSLGKLQNASTVEVNKVLLQNIKKIQVIHLRYIDFKKMKALIFHS